MSGAGLIRRGVEALESLVTSGIPGVLGVIPTDPSTFNTASADARFVLGGTYWYGGNFYKYFQFKDAVTYVATHSVEYASVGCTTVTNDRAGGSSLGRISAGKATRVHTTDFFGFSQVSGPVTLLTSGADDIAVGEGVFCHATTDGTVDGTSASTFNTGLIGVATEADDNAANTVAAILWLPK